MCPAKTTKSGWKRESKVKNEDSGCSQSLQQQLNSAPLEKETPEAVPLIVSEVLSSGGVASGPLTHGQLVALAIWPEVTHKKSSPKE